MAQVLAKDDKVGARAALDVQRGFVRTTRSCRRTAGPGAEHQWLVRGDTAFTRSSAGTGAAPERPPPCVKLGGTEAQLQAIPPASECLCLCMMLGDASVWIDHLSQGDAELMVALEAGEVGMYSFVVGELPCCDFRSRAEVLSLLKTRPSMPMCTEEGVLFLIDRHELVGRGIGFFDAQFSGTRKTGRRPAFASRQATPHHRD